MNTLPLRLLLIDIANANDSVNKNVFIGVSMFPAKRTQHLLKIKKKGIYLDRCVVTYSGYLCRPRVVYRSSMVGWRRLGGWPLEVVRLVRVDAPLRRVRPLRSRGRGDGEGVEGCDKRCSKLCHLMGYGIGERWGKAEIETCSGIKCGALVASAEALITRGGRGSQSEEQGVPPGSIVVDLHM